MYKFFGTIAAGTLAISLAQAQPAEPRTAEQVYKNITHLKGTPADQSLPAMQGDLPGRARHRQYL